MMSNLLQIERSTAFDCVVRLQPIAYERGFYGYRNAVNYPTHERLRLLPISLVREFFWR